MTRQTIHLKTKEDIAHMKVGGTILHDVLIRASESLRPGMTTNELDRLIEQSILDRGGQPGFKRVKGYSWATCICVNEQIVHTPPSERMLQEGDVVTIDAGVYYNGLHTDSGLTCVVGEPTKKIEHFLKAGMNALKLAIAQAVRPHRIGHISQAFQKAIESEGYTIVRELTGHGVGKDLHEDPYIPCYLDRPIHSTLPLEVGMTLALEVMYTEGKGKIEYEKDGWSIKTSDGAIAGMFEHTIAITEKGTFILT